MTISAKVIADSISPQGHRLTSMQLRYPRFIHAEELTNRVISTGTEMIEVTVPDGFMYDKNLSRNASSSRAIPTPRLIADVISDPVEPFYWGSNKPGMQAGAELDGAALRMAKSCWHSARDAAIHWAQSMHNIGAAKQIVNRVIEPYSHINVVCTATNYANFYALRRHPDAQPEIHVLADAMWEAQQGSTPKLLQPGQWHLPYVDPTKEMDLLPTRPKESTQDWGDYFTSLLIKISVARCARVSYLTHEGKTPSVEEDLKLYDRLVGSTPLHASPAEHQATPDRGYLDKTCEWQWNESERHGNLRGWIQYRKTLPGEHVPG